MERAPVTLRVCAVVGAVISVVAAGLPSPSYADATDRYPWLPIAFGSRYATPVEVENAVGTPSYEMTRCPQGSGGSDGRLVTVQLEKPNFDNAAVASSVLRDAAAYAYEQCPRHFMSTNWGETDLPLMRDVSKIVLVLPDGQIAFEASLGGLGRSGDFPFSPGPKYEWGDFINRAALRKQQEDADAARAAQQARQAEWNRQASIPGTPAYAVNGGPSIVDIFKMQLAFLWLVIRLVFFGSIAIFLWLKREQIITFFYGLTPHPAAGTISSALSGGGPIDGTALSSLLQVRPGNRYEQAARQQQAASLARALRQRAEQQARWAETAKEEALRNAAFARTQTEVARAAEAHEVAQAQVEALRRRGVSSV